MTSGSVALVDLVVACADEKLTPLVNKRRLSCKDRECISGWQSELNNQLNDLRQLER